MQQDFIGVEDQPTCFLCGKHGKVLYRDLEDHLFGVSGKWTFRKCTDSVCGLIWMDPMPKSGEVYKTYQNYYTHGQPRSSNYTLPARFIRAMFHAPCMVLLDTYSERKRYKQMYLDQTPTGRILEIGCGSGKRLARMKALGWEVMGQEIDPVAARHVRKAWGIEVHMGPLETMEVPHEKFDVVIMSHVIEHVPNPVSLLSNCYHFLKQNGLLVLITPNAASYGHRKFGMAWRGLEPPRHLHLFTSETLISISKKAGFERQLCWTTAVSANAIGQGSALPLKAAQEGCRIVTARDAMRGILFEIMARLAFLKMKDSGEECVLMATKENAD